MLFHIPLMTLDDLTPQQRDYFIDWAQRKDTTPQALLNDFRRDPWMTNAITGVLPHCGLYGLMEADCRCHT